MGLEPTTRSRPRRQRRAAEAVRGVVDDSVRLTETGVDPTVLGDAYVAAAFACRQQRRKGRARSAKQRIVESDPGSPTPAEKTPITRDRYSDSRLPR
jgi:hypothetical protein